jgi:hypothetical protein
VSPFVNTFFRVTFWNPFGQSHPPFCDASVIVSKVISFVNTFFCVVFSHLWPNPSPPFSRRERHCIKASFICQHRFDGIYRHFMLWRKRKQPAAETQSSQRQPKRGRGIWISARSMCTGP